MIPFVELLAHLNEDYRKNQPNPITNVNAKYSVWLCPLHDRGSGPDSAASSSSSSSAPSGCIEQVVLIQVIVNHFKLLREDFQLQFESDLIDTYDI